jgi:hypothetical protein
VERVDDDVDVGQHAADGEVRADPVLDAVRLDLVQRVDAAGEEGARFQGAQFLSAFSDSVWGVVSSLTSCQSHSGVLSGSVLAFSMTKLAVRSRHRASTALPFFSLLTWTGISRGKQPSRWTHGRMNAQVLAGSESQAHKVLVEAVDVASVLHQPLQLGQSLLDFGNRARTVDELALLGVELAKSPSGPFGELREANLLVGHNQRQQRHGLAGPRRHLKHAVALCTFNLA